jgi:hypothetical protein
MKTIKKSKGKLNGLKHKVTQKGVNLTYREGNKN